MTADAFPPWAWIPIVLLAALAQTAHNAAQRALVAQAGTLGATLARFLYGLPFAAVAVAALHALPATAAAWPAFDAPYFAWLALGAVSQLAATAFLLATLRQRNFVVGVAYSKTDALQVALLGTLLLAEWPGWVALLAIGLATAGVLLLSLPQGSGASGTSRASAGTPAGAVGWSGLASLYGLLSGAGFALAAVGYRGAALALGDTPVWLLAAWGVLWAQALQSVLLGGWLALRTPAALWAMAQAWRVALGAGAMGALASFGWFAAFALATAAQVRTLGMVEVVFSYLVGARWLREQLRPLELAGLALVCAGLLILTAGL